MKKNIILASQSPRRLELLKMLGVTFSVKVREIDERLVQEGVVRDWQAGRFVDLGAALVSELSLQKARAVWEELSSDEQADFLIIGADTVVMLDNEVLGKPRDKEDARDMIFSLCGRKHQVYTGVSIISNFGVKTFCEIADVFFAPLDEIQLQCIDSYLMSDDAMDKAGAYGIQGQAAMMIERIEGDYYTIMGLPIHRLYRELQEFIDM